MADVAAGAVLDDELCALWAEVSLGVLDVVLAVFELELAGGFCAGADCWVWVVTPPNDLAFWKSL